MSTRQTRSGWWRQRRRPDSDFHAEVQAHLDLEAERLRAEGLGPADADAAARRMFGSVLAAEERFYERQRWTLLDQMLRDVRYAVRSLRKSPAFAATTVLTLAVGLGLITIAFAIMNAYLLRPFAVRDPFHLYTVAWGTQHARGAAFSWRDYELLRDRHDLFEGVLVSRVKVVESEGRKLQTEFVSGNYFDLLGVRTQRGRALSEADARAPGSDPVVVLSDQTWARLYDRDPAVLGRTIDLKGHPFVIVGILAPEFAGLDASPQDVWVPITMYETLLGKDLFGPENVDAARDLDVVARLRSDVTAERAQEALTPLMTDLIDDAKAVRALLYLRATPNPLTVDSFVLMSPVFVAFGLVLLAACANVSNVMLARATARYREIAVRLSLGASRGRVVRQLVTEGLLIAVLAGLTGMLFANLGLRAAVAAFLATMPPAAAAVIRIAPLDPDWRVFLFVLAVSGGATILFALVPALQATRLSLTDALRGQPSQGLQRSTLRNVLVVCQVAVSLILLILDATLIRNSAAVAAVDLGFATQGVTALQQRINGPSLVTSAAGVLRQDGRVETVVITSHNPLFGPVPKAPMAPGQELNFAGVGYRYVSPDYFPLLRIPILRGRAFTLDEARAEAPVVIVSASTAARLWPGEDPVGKTVRAGFPPDEDSLPDGARTRFLVYKKGDVPTKELTVVGVAGDVSSEFVYIGKDEAIAYLPTEIGGKHAKALLVRARTTQDPREDAVQTALQRVHPDPMAFEAMPLEQMLALQIYPLQAASWVGLVVCVLALILSVSGLYGVMTYTLSQRTREIGIRMALGATAVAVVRLVMTQSARVAAIGAVIGAVITFSALKVLSTFVRLRNVSIVDSGAFLVGLLLVTLAVAIAAWWPARRATRVDPSVTLRVDA
jgi:predicted permease